MAELLIQRWRLAVLRVVLDVSGRAPQVTTSLVGYPEGRRHEYWTRHDPLDGFGLAGLTPDRPPDELQVPVALRDAVLDTLREHFGSEAALWLRIVPPSGYLGAVPWEESFAETMRLPVLRVPDRLPVGAASGRAWTMAAIVNGMRGQDWGSAHVRRLVDALRRVPVPVELDVFADAATYTGLADPLGDEHVAVRLHDPGTAAQAHRDRQARAVSFSRRGYGSGAMSVTGTSDPAAHLLWADWVAEGLAGRAVRGLHVVTDAMLDGDRPLLSAAVDPASPSDAWECSYVTGDDVRRLADSLGAETLSFGSPPDNRSDVATRLVADTAGLQRSGPTLYLDLRAPEQDPERVLGEAVAFLVAGGDEPVPTDPRLFAYLQPEHLQAALAEPVPAPAMAAPEDPRAPSSPGSWPGFVPGRVPERGARPVEDWKDADVVPTWVASSERYLDAGYADLAKSAAPPPQATSTFPGIETKSAYDDGQAFALRQLEELVTKHARRS